MEIPVPDQYYEQFQELANRNEKAKLIYYLPSLALYLTVMIATPVATEFRYVYFMIFSLPFYLMVVVLQEPDAVKEKLPEESS